MLRFTKYTEISACHAHVGADAYGTDGNQYAGHGLGLQQEDITQFLLPVSYTHLLEAFPVLSRILGVYCCIDFCFLQISVDDFSRVVLAVLSQCLSLIHISLARICAKAALLVLVSPNELTALSYCP